MVALFSLQTFDCCPQISFPCFGSRSRTQLVRQCLAAITCNRIGEKGYSVHYELLDTNTCTQTLFQRVC
ncbi:uncharacterized protein ARMOST_13709 [Armillaria ostoyae]|uniref:Uncharacterized protein n=1 Tax=Armillaria ostoyae TaxID=47428 RepID=A0A284RNN6_ARMOS|nr:uncharacterized protein ARMOST_13709 [Armillaria ostoyae]